MNRHEIIEKYLTEQCHITPGPWHMNNAIRVIFSDKRTDLYGGDGRDDLFVCYMDFGEYGHNQIEKNWEANGKLLCQARELLVADIVVLWKMEKYHQLDDTLRSMQYLLKAKVHSVLKKGWGDVLGELVKLEVENP